MLTLLYARAGHESRRELLERMGRSEARRRLLIVPEQYSHESERDMCRVLGNGASRECEVLSFTRLAGRVADAAGGGAAPMLDGGGRMLLMCLLGSLMRKSAIRRHIGNKFNEGMLAPYKKEIDKLG